jgi:hypothetical protein
MSGYFLGSEPTVHVSRFTFHAVSCPHIQRAHPTHEQAVLDLNEALSSQPASELRRPWKRLGGFWQPGIGRPMFGNEAAESRQHPSKVQLVKRSEPRPRGKRHLQDHQSRTGGHHPRGLSQSGVEIGQVAYSPPHHHSIELRRRKGELQSISGDRREAGRLDSTELEHPRDEVGADYPPPEAGLPSQRGAEVERSGAQVEIDSLRRALPPQPPDRNLPPALIEPEADDAVEPVIRRGDSGEDLANVGPLFRAAGNG